MGNSGSSLLGCMHLQLLEKACNTCNGLLHFSIFPGFVLFYFFREATATGFGRQGCRLPDPTMDPLAHSWSPVLCFCKMNHSEWHCQGKVVWWEGSVYMCLLPTQTNCTMLSLTLEGVWRTTPVHRQAYWQRSSKLQKSLPRQISLERRLRGPTQQQPPCACCVAYWPMRKHTASMGCTYRIFVVYHIGLKHIETPLAQV